MGDDSVELCGGTHVARTGDLGVFRIISEGGVAAGVRRIEARTGWGALAWLNDGEQVLAEVSDVLKAQRDTVALRVRQQGERIRELEKELERVQQQMARQAGADLAAQAVSLGSVRVLAASLPGIDPKTLRDSVDQLRNQLGSSVVVLATVAADRVSLAVGVSSDVVGRVKAGELVSFVAAQVGGKGGGRPDFAMAGGQDAAALPAALASVSDWVQSRLG